MMPTSMPASSGPTNGAIVPDRADGLNHAGPGDDRLRGQRQSQSLGEFKNILKAVVKRRRCDANDIRLAQVTNNIEFVQLREQCAIVDGRSIFDNQRKLAALRIPGVTMPI